MSAPPSAAPAPAPEPRRPTRPALWQVCAAGALALAVAMGIGRFAFTPLLPLMQREGLLTADGGAWLAAANYLGYLLGALSAARLTARPRRLVLACLFGTAALTAAVALTQSLGPWLVLRWAAGVASAWTLVSVSSWSGAALAAAGRPDASGWVFAGVGLGIAFAGGLAWAAEPAGAPMLWIVLGASAAIVAMLVQRLWRSAASGPAGDAENGSDARITNEVASEAASETASETASAAASSRRAAALSHGSRALVICYGCFGFGYILPATYLPAMARDLVDDPRWFGLAWPVFGLAAALSTLLAGRAIARWGLLRVWAACHLTMAAGCWLPLFSRSGWAIGGAALCVGGTFMVATMAGLRQARQLFPRSPAPLLARMTAAFAAGQIAGPLVALALSRLPLGLGSAGSGVEASWVLAGLVLVTTAGWLYRMSNRVSNDGETLPEPAPTTAPHRG